MSGLSLRHPRAALAAWIAAVIVLAVLGFGVEQRLHRTNASVPGTPSAQATELAERHFGESHPLLVMLAGPPEAIEAQAGTLSARLRKLGRVAVLGPTAPGAERMLRPRRDRLLLLLRVEDGFERVSAEVVPAIREEMRRTVRAPVRAHLSGYPDIANGINEASVESLRRAELIAGPLLLLVLLLVFRSPVAAAVPLGLGVLTIAAAAGVLDLANRLTPIDVVGLNMASMFGLALAVDYSLLVVSRFREELAACGDTRQAAGVAVRTAGRTVFFAGLVLGAAMVAAALVAPGTLLLSGGIGTIVAVAVSVVGATTALPALLVLGGHHLDRWRIGRPAAGGTRWGRAVAAAVRRPLAAAASILALLLLLATPALGLDVAVPDPRALPESRVERQDFEAIRQTMPDGWMAPYEIVVVARSGAVTGMEKLERLDRWQERLSRHEQVLAVLGPAPIYDRMRTARRQLRRVKSQLEGGRRGLRELSGGVQRLERAMDDVRAGLSEASGSAARVAGGAAEADGAAAGLRRGLLRARSGAEKVRDAAAATVRGAARLAAGARQARRGAARLKSDLGRARAAASGGEGDVARLAQELRDGATGLRDLREPVKVTEAALGRARAALERMSVLAKADPSYREAYEEVLRALGAVTGRHPRDGSEVRAGYRGMDAELAAASEQLGRGADAVARLQDGSRALAGGLARLADGADRLADGVGRVAAGNEQLLRSIRRLESGGGRLRDGLGELVSGSSRLDAGADELERGARQLASGLGGGVQRTSKIARGLDRVDGGTRKLAKGSDGLPGGGVSTRITGSPYFTLAGLDAARGGERVAATFAVNVDEGGSATRLVVIGRGDPTDPESRLRRHLDAEAARQSRESGMVVAVGGPAAQLQDFSEAAAGRLWLLALVLSGVTYLVLVPILRSLLLPLLAVVLNLLTVAAAFGVLVVLFVGDAPLGGPGKLDAITVRAILSIVFALSIDYAVFLLARVREGYVRTGDTAQAIDYGLRNTASVVTGAALIMVGVFAAFALSPVTSMRALGVGLTVAVVLDATLVRLVLLPAAIRLLGDACWWLPPRIGRRLPRLSLES